MHQPRQIFRVNHADDMLGPARLVIYRYPRVLMVDDRSTRRLNQRVCGQRHDLLPWSHNLAHWNFLHLQCAMNQPLLKRWQYAHPPSRRRNQLQLFRRMDRSLTCHWHPEEPQHNPRRILQEPHRRPRHRHEQQHRPSHGNRHILSASQRQRLGHQFPKQHMQIGDNAEAKSDGSQVRIDNRMGQRLRQHFKPAEENIRRQRLADPAQSQAAKRHAKLHRRQESIQIPLQPAHRHGARNPRRNHLLHPRLAHRNQRELRGDKESIGQDQDSYGDDLEQRQTVHDSRFMGESNIQ